MEEKFTLLLVDDEPQLLDLMALDLKLQGYEVFTANGGRAAFELFQAEKIDLVITDVNMAGGDGLELLDRIMEQSPGLPVVLMTAGYKVGPKEARERGAIALVPKPFDWDALVHVVQSGLQMAAASSSR